MKIKLLKCPILNDPIKQTTLWIEDNIANYKSDIMGKVRITMDAIEMLDRNQFPIDRYSFAGIIRIHNLYNTEAILIDSDFLKNLNKNYNLPNSNKQKKNEALINLNHILSGSDAPEVIETGNDSSLAYCTPHEFEKILDTLIEEDLLRYDHKSEVLKTYLTTHLKLKYFTGLKLTRKGKLRAGKLISNNEKDRIIPYKTVGIVEIDKKIQHAKELFYNKSDSLDHKRSACRELSMILEPIREEMKEVFSKKDINTLFQIVNDFDIRHDTRRTLYIEQKEQFEWLFYCLLNSIITYYKLRKKLT